MGTHEEVELANYSETASKMYNGLSLKEVRKLAFQYDMKNDNVRTRSWKIDEMARADWFTHF
jgi:hypothetical protein